jgi:hypothetical protein
MTESTGRHAVRFTFNDETVDGTAVSGFQVAAQTRAKGKKR